MAVRKPTVGDPKIAVASLRVSTDDQQLGLDAQRSAIQRWAATNGVQIVAWHVDQGISGGKPVEDRPGLAAALEALTIHGAGVLIVAKRDRLARDVVIAATIERLAERAGARVVSADGVGDGDSPESALMRTLVDAFAAYERSIIRTRTRMALAHKKAVGELVGKVPTGFTAIPSGRTKTTKDGTVKDIMILQADPREQAAMARIAVLHQSGMSLRQIGKALTNEGFTPRGAAWQPSTIRRTIERQSTLAEAN